MKRILVAILISACLISVLASIKAINAAQPGYNVNDYLAITTPTIEGNWTPTDEWTDAEQKQLEGSLTVYFRIKWTQANVTAGTPVYEYILIDFVSDTTDNATDGFSICLDALHDNGTAPQTDDYMIQLDGHSFSGFKVYRGTGTAWVLTTDYHWPGDVVVVNDINPSPNSPTPHWIAEFRINASWANLYNGFNIRVAAYDANGGGNNVWPNSLAAVPDGWGATTTMFTTIPEFPIPAVLLVLFAAVTLVIVRFRKTLIKPKLSGY